MMEPWPALAWVLLMTNIAEWVKSVESRDFSLTDIILLHPSSTIIGTMIWREHEFPWSTLGLVEEHTLSEIEPSRRGTSLLAKLDMTLLVWLGFVPDKANQEAMDAQHLPREWASREVVHQRVNSSFRILKQRGTMCLSQDRSQCGTAHQFGTIIGTMIWREHEFPWSTLGLVDEHTLSEIEPSRRGTSLLAKLDMTLLVWLGFVPDKAIQEAMDAQHLPREWASREVVHQRVNSSFRILKQRGTMCLSQDRSQCGTAHQFATPHPGGFKCFTCQDAADNYECNRWAPDVYCPKDARYCYTLHMMDNHGGSVSVTKRCVTLEDCRFTGCAEVTDNGYQVCSSCCEGNICNMLVPRNESSAVFSSTSPLVSSSRRLGPAILCYVITVIIIIFTTEHV